MKLATFTRSLCTLVFAILFVGSALAQGVTTSSINGKITDTNGEALIGANILAIHTPTGTTYGNATNLDGIYRIPNMRVGGPYKITVSYTGYEPFIKEGIYLRLGQSFNFSPELSETALELAGIEVTAVRNDIFDGNRTGAETTITEEQINALPTVSRSLGDFTRLTPQSTAREGNDGFALSFAGQNNRYNAIYIDGAVNNDVFGLAGSGTNGGQTGVSPISVDAIEELQINLAPFDVRIGGFSGAAISAITRSGTNNWEGSVYGFYRDENFIREEFEGATVDEFSAYTAGFRVGGPIIKDKLFFFVNVETSDETTPRPFNFDNYLGASDRSDIDALINKLNGFGYDPGTFENNEQFLESQKVNFKLDYNINQDHKLAFRFGWVRADNLEGVQSSNRNIRFLNSSERFLSNTYSTALELNSIFGATIANNLTIGFTAVRDDRDPNGDPFPFVRIDDGDGSIQFGSERFSTANLLDQDVLTITDNLEFYLGKHTLTVGTHNEFYNVGNLFIASNFGLYDFASLDDFLNDERPDDFERLYSLVDNVTGDESNAIAAFNAGQIGFYVQDEFQATDDFKVTLGVRLDVPFYDDTPTNEFFNNETIPLIEEFYDLQGARTGQFIEPQLQFSPRLGFNWDVNGKNQTQVRGGVGMFTSRAPLVWVGGAFNNYGLNVGFTGNIPDQFEPAFNKQPPGEIDLNNVQPGGSIDLFAEDFKLPQLVKFNLAVDQKLPWGLIGNIDFLYNLTLQNVAYQNLNLKPAVGNLEGGPDDRPIFDRRDEVDPTYGRILLGYNTDEGYSYNISASLTKPFDNGFSGTIAYSYSDAESIFDGTSSQNSSQWRGFHSIGGRNFDQQLARSQFAAGSRFIAGLTYEIEYAEYFKTTISLFHESLQGQPYSFVYSNGQNLKNEDSRNRELIFIPASQADINLVEANGFTPDQQWEALNNWIENNDYLSENRGTYAERNAEFGPWSHVMDLRLLQDFAFDAGGKKHIFQISLDIFNFTNLLNEDWGRRDFYFSNLNSIRFEGFEGETNVPTFSFNPEILNADNEIEPAFDDSGIQSSRWNMQLGLRYIFK